MTADDSGKRFETLPDETAPSRPPSNDQPHVSADPIRWSAVWAGFLVALSVFLLIELLFFAFGWLTLETTDRGAAAGIVTALIGLVAFLIGGYVAGAGSIWFGVREGLMHGVLVWALSLVVILLLSLLGGGALFGVASNVFSDLAATWRGGATDEQMEQALQTARDGAGWAFAGILAYLIAAMAGGAAGVKMAKARQETTPVTRS